MVPKAPASTKTLTCMSPVWPFDARSYPDFNGPGRTRLVVEKGGVRIPFTGTGAPPPFLVLSGHAASLTPY